MGALTPTIEGERADLLRSAVAGDELAFRRPVSEHHEDMRRVCLAIFGDHSIAEDAAQAAWAVAWQKLHKVRGPAQLRPWLVSVAVNEAKQLTRKRRRRAQVEVAAHDSRESGESDPATAVSKLDLRVAMANLKPDERALLAMRYVAGFDSNELSAATGISPSGTRSRIERLLKRLREELADA